jgi:hypothetical protein
MRSDITEGEVREANNKLSINRNRSIEFQLTNDNLLETEKRIPSTTDFKVDFTDTTKTGRLETHD